MSNYKLILCTDDRSQYKINIYAEVVNQTYIYMHTICVCRMYTYDKYYLKT